MQESPESAVPGDTVKDAREPDRHAEQKRDRKFWMAMAAYGVLGVLIWFTVGEGKVAAFGRPVEIRLIPLLVIGSFAFRTYIAREADKLRRRSEGGA